MGSTGDDAFLDVIDQAKRELRALMSAPA
jgi:hypothetical protein